MKKIISFVMLCLCVMGAIGGIGYSLYCGAYPIAVGVVALAYAAWPKFREYFINLTL